MVTYYFDVRKGNDLVEDHEGETFASLVDAKLDAVKSAREIIADRAKAGQQAEYGAIEIRSDAGAVVATAHFRFVVQVSEPLAGSVH